MSQETEKFDPASKSTKELFSAFIGDIVALARRTDDPDLPVQLSDIATEIAKRIDSKATRGEGSGL
jgi:hypothetical protein